MDLSGVSLNIQCCFPVKKSLVDRYGSKDKLWCRWSNRGCAEQAKPLEKREQTETREEKHRRAGTFGLSCPKNLRNFRMMRDCWNRNTNALRLHEFDKQTRSQFTLSPEIFRGSLLSWILDFSKKIQIWISAFIRRNNFSWISCTVFDSDKTGSHMIVFVTLSLQIIHWSSAMNFCWQEFIFTGFNYRRSMKNLRRSHVNFIPHGYFKNS